MKHLLPKFRLLATGLFLVTSLLTVSQNNVGIGTTTPDASSALEVQSTNKGVLVPRVTTAQRIAIPAPANGLLVYDTTVDCFFYYITAITSWQSMCTAGTGGTGATGPTGAAGTIGVNGVTGATGDTGPTGIGVAGTNGANGTNGTNGINCWDQNGNGINDPLEDTNGDGLFNTIDCINGVVGPTGPAGANGSNGAIGPQGPIGITGNNGTNGAVGPIGPIGPAGANGTNGAIGATGPQGPIGLTGANGTNGTNGAVGANGTNGTNGTNGAVGPTGPTWTINSDNFNADGSLAIVTSIPSTITSINMAWLLGGNSTTALRQMGSTGAQPVNFITSNIERFRMTAAGQISANNTTPAVGGVITAYGTGVAGAIAAVANDGVVGYSNSAGNGIVGSQGNLNGTGVFGINSGAGIGGAAVYGFSPSGVDGVIGDATGLMAFPIWGQNGFATGTGVVGMGNNLGTSVYMNQGAGASFTGNFVGVHGCALSQISTGATLREGGYFASGASGAGPFTFSVWAHVAALTNAGITGNGVTARKIEGVGTVNTTVEDINGNMVVLSCPEAPENLFQDYGQAQLNNGRAHIDIDPTFAKNITVNSKHPLRVFVQLEGDCKGVYVENKTGNGFDVVELAGGNSNVKFSYTIVANRSDQKMGQYDLLFADERFGKAIGENPSGSKASNTEIKKSADLYNQATK